MYLCGKVSLPPSPLQGLLAFTGGPEMKPVKFQPVVFPQGRGDRSGRRDIVYF